MSSDLYEQIPTDKNMFDKIKDFVCSFNSSNVLMNDSYFTRNRCKF